MIHPEAEFLCSCKLETSDKLCASKILQWNRHGVDIPIAKERNRKEERGPWFHRNLAPTRDKFCEIFKVREWSSGSMPCLLGPAQRWPSGTMDAVVALLTSELPLGLFPTVKDSTCPSCITILAHPVDIPSSILSLLSLIVMAGSVSADTNFSKALLVSFIIHSSPRFQTREFSTQPPGWFHFCSWHF